MFDDTHVFQGMRRDSHPIKQEKQFLWDALNIRLTTRDDNTMLSITNEKSTREIVSFNTDETYMGHCILGDYIVVFTHSTSVDRIYRFYKGSTFGILDNSSSTIQREILYQGKLSFDVANPIQAIGDYESELIQKVYWVDGINSPRVINIKRPELDGAEYDSTKGYTDCYTDEPFGFVQDLNLNEKVEVSRLDNGSGQFVPGVIQYAFTYYHRYGQESNIFDISEPLYVAYEDRGGNPDSSLSTAFQIKVSGLQSNFEYLRIYSILRTTIDATPTVKRVTDIAVNGQDSVSYVDNGTTGDTVDPDTLLYIGGKDIVAGCISSKDNTLFLGDITYKREAVTNIDGLEAAAKNLLISESTRTEQLSSSSSNSSNGYNYINQLSKNTSTFKHGETYRLGIQLQYRTGEWSEPIFVKDAKIETSKPSLSGASLTLPTLKTAISSIYSLVKDKDYLKIRPLIARPDWKDRTILAQGILCPTVFQTEARNSNAPFAQASWLLRPFSTITPNENSNLPNSTVPEFRHFYPLVTGLSSAAEIQNMFLESGNDSVSSTTEWDTSSDDYTRKPSLKVVADNINSTSGNTGYKSIYFVDQSIVTMHSPDVEFSDALKLAIDRGTNFKVRVVGVVPFNLNYGDIDVQVSSVVVDPDAAGFIHRSLTANVGAYSLISGLFYEDAWVDDGKNANEFYKNDSPRPWMTHMWHRSGSLNNDCVRPEGKGTRTSVLKKKIISNLKYSNNTIYISPFNIDIDHIQSFSGEDVSLVKLKDAYNTNGKISYFGNVDTMNPSYSKFRMVIGNQTLYEASNSTATFGGVVKSYSDDKEGSYTFSNLKVKNIYGSKTTGYISGDIESGSIKVYTSNGNDAEGNPQYVYSTISCAGGTFSITIADDNSYTGTIEIGDETFTVSGSTTYDFSVKKKASSESSFNAGASLLTVDPNRKRVGDYQEALKLAKDAVRIKYKSTPHLVIANAYNTTSKYRTPLPVLSGTQIGTVSAADQWWIEGASGNITPETKFVSGISATTYLWLAEVYMDNVLNRYGETNSDGTPTDGALQDNIWLPAGPAIRLDSNSDLVWIWGDTWYQRYDVLKTYPFTTDDENQVVEIGSFMCETRTNIDGRYDRNRGLTSNLNVSPSNFNLINPIYSQLNSFFNYSILDDDYYLVDSYPSQLMYSGTKTPASAQDTWTNLHMASTLDLDGSCGRLVAIQPFNELLIGLQESGVQQILFNSRVQLAATDGVPIEIANSQKVEGTRAYSNVIGCQDKFSMVSTPMGIYFLDNASHAMYLFNGELTNLGLQMGSMYWPRENYSTYNWRFDPQDGGTNSIRLFYDSKFQDVYFTPGADSETEDGKVKLSYRNALCYSEQLGQFTSFMSYGGAVMFSFKSGFYSIARDKKDGTLKLWENFPNKSEKYNTIFNERVPYYFSFISNDSPTVTKIFDTVEMRTDMYKDNTLQGSKYSTTTQEGQPFSYIRADNEYQDSGEVEFNSSTLRKKFRLWRALVPRQANSRARIRNPWAKITLGMNKDNCGDKMTILHDLTVNYTI